MTRSRVIRPERDQQPCVVDPTLSELLEDSLVRLLMASDGVEPRSVWSLFTDLANQRARFSKRPALPEWRNTQANAQARSIVRARRT